RRGSNSDLRLHAGPPVTRPRIGRAAARSRHRLVGFAGRRRPDGAAATRPSAAKLLPALMPASHCLLVATPAPIGAPPARTAARSTSCMTSAEPESGADDAEALSAGRWDHLSRLPESPTRAEVTETTRCDATPRHPPRQTVQRGRAGAA